MYTATRAGARRLMPCRSTIGDARYALLMARVSSHRNRCDLNLSTTHACSGAFASVGPDRDASSDQRADHGSDERLRPRDSVGSHVHRTTHYRRRCRPVQPLRQLLQLRPAWRGRQPHRSSNPRRQEPRSPGPAPAATRDPSQCRLLRWHINAVRSRLACIEALPLWRRVTDQGGGTAPGAVRGLPR